MRLPTLLVIFLAGSIYAVTAKAQSQPNTTSQDFAQQGCAQDSGQPETLRFRLGTPINSTSLISEVESQENSYQFPVDSLEFKNRAACFKIRSYHVVRVDPDSAVCYKIRSYHVVREGQDSDVVRMDGYTTCQPASKYQTKRTVLVQP